MTDTTAHAPDSASTPAPAPAPSEANVSEFVPVIRSKIQPPPLRSTTLTRQRLIDRLDEATQARVTLLVAEAGYGKTTLLADFAARSGRRTLWYRLDPTDADPITWTNYLIAACREVDPSFGTGSLRLLLSGPTGSIPRSALWDSVIAELAAWTAAPTLLVLDDFHRVDRLAEACGLVHRLFEMAPAWLHIVISTRRRPPLELARFAAAGELSELNSDDLRFSDAETEKLFSEGYGTPLDNDILRAIDQRTRGWAASLALVHGSIRNKSREAALQLAQELSGASKPIYDFLAEEVLAAVPNEVESLLMRASILDSITVEDVLALFARDVDRRTVGDVRHLVEQADELGLLSRTSRSDDQREMHPLLRDFLQQRLKDRFGDEEVRQLHRSVATAANETDPLKASRHFISAGDPGRAMSSLESSILKTIGSGRWGLAAELIDNLREMRPGPGVAAILARQLMEDGDLIGAERALEAVDADSQEPLVRTALRQTQLSLGWRLGKPEMVRSAAKAMVTDAETASPIREIAQLFVDTDIDGSPQPLPVIARRLERLAETQATAGLDFYGAVALHNATTAYLWAGQYQACLDVGRRSLSTFGRLHLQATEALSTHSILAVALMESGRYQEARVHVAASMDSGREFADVPAAIALAYFAVGETEEAERLVTRARTLEAQGQGDLSGSQNTAVAEAFSVLAQSPARAADMLSGGPIKHQLDLGQSLETHVMLAHAQLAAGERTSAVEVASSGLETAIAMGATRTEVRFMLLMALATEDREAIETAVHRARKASHLALPELADVICHRLDLAEGCLDEIGAAIADHPRRWLPLLRRQLGRGAPEGDLAALLLDRHGELRDVGMLRAYARTYKGRGPTAALGLALARRTSPMLRIHDLGRVILEVGGRSVALSGIRRKAAALLMYLVSRPSFTAHRDQVIDDLWPDADPGSALNSLNQSLYFLRREIDPWYEDGVSPDYIGFAGDLIWLDADLTTSDGAEFLATAHKLKDRPTNELLDGLRSYAGHFAPEFEYEEWALSFRSKLRTKFLETASSAVARMVKAGEYDDARSVVLLALEADDAAIDLERVLIWLHWRLGARSAARAQFEHLKRSDELDGFESVRFGDLVDGPAPLDAQ
jgi:DNA-binding SARP family transcriptional activator